MPVAVGYESPIPKYIVIARKLPSMRHRRKSNFISGIIFIFAFPGNLACSIEQFAGRFVT
jgi:hypothetical protein